MLAQEFYEQQRKLGLTEDITGEPEPDYSLPFYQNIFRLMVDFSDQQTAEKDKRIKELEEAAKSYIDKLEKELTSQLTEGVSLDVDGLNVALKKWSEVLTKINK